MRSSCGKLPPTWEPEHGCLWIFDADDQQTAAFTPNGMDYLRDMLPEYKRN